MAAGMLDLYHRTTPEAAADIARTRRMTSLENTREAYFSTSLHGQATGYGDGVVHVRVPAELAELDDEFPDGEQHYRVHIDRLQPQHFVQPQRVHTHAGRCCDCGRHRQVARIKRFGGGTYRRGGRWYDTSVCRDCIDQLVPYAEHATHAGATTSRFSARDVLRLAAAEWVA